MRLFAALPVTGAAQHELERLLADLARLGWPVRWVRPEGLHLTLKFFGEVAEEGAGPIVDLLAEACGHAAPFGLEAAELGGFPGLQAARVVWAGYRAEPPLELLAHRVAQRASTLGFAAEGRPFRPHVTLGRLRDGASLDPAAIARLESVALAESLEADRLVLYQSLTGPGGARYLPVETFQLGQ